MGVTLDRFPRHVAAGVTSDDVVPNDGCWVVHFGQKVVGMSEIARGNVEGKKLGDYNVLVRETIEKYLCVNLNEGVYAVAIL